METVGPLLPLPLAQAILLVTKFTEHLFCARLCARGVCVYAGMSVELAVWWRRHTQTDHFSRR